MTTTTEARPEVPLYGVIGESVDNLVPVIGPVLETLKTYSGELHPPTPDELLERLSRFTARLRAAGIATLIPTGKVDLDLGNTPDGKGGWTNIRHLAAVETFIGIKG